MKKICMIAAVTLDRGIGKDGKLLFKLSEDLIRFKSLTMNNVVIMGQTTFESIGKALPYRINIVISNDKNFEVKDCIIVYSIEKSLEVAKMFNRDIFIIGGASIYRQMIKYCHKLYITLIDKIVPADTYFPNYHRKFCIEYESEIYKQDDISFMYLELFRKFN